MYNLSSVLSMLKAQQWETAKGALRATAIMQGAYIGTTEQQTLRWKEATAAVEAFIKDFENEGLQE